MGEALFRSHAVRPRVCAAGAQHFEGQIMSTTTMPADTAAIRRVSWGSIFAGTVVALALMVFFTTLGLAIGAAAVDPLYESNPLSGLGVGSGIYLVLTQLISLAIGGFAAARLAGVPRTVASLLHGAAVWSVATVLLTWAAVSGGGALFGAASTALGNTASGAANVVRAVAPEDLSFPDLSDVASGISIDNLPPEIREALEESGITADQLRRETRETFRDVVSQQEQQRAVSVLQGALADALRNPGDIGSQVDEAVEGLFAGPDAVFSQEDREEVVADMQERLGLTSAQSDQLVQSVEEGIEAAAEDLRQTLDQIQQQALEIAQRASSVLATTAAWLSFASLLGLAAAMAGAFAGKPDGLLGDRLDDHF